MPPRAALVAKPYVTTPKAGQARMVTISRLYKDYETGARVVAELERSGIPQDDISIIANNERWLVRPRWLKADRPRCRWYR